MNLDKIKSNIKDQIAKTNRSFDKNGRLGVKNPLPEDIDSLERNLKTTNYETDLEDFFVCIFWLLDCICWNAIHSHND